jgi:hypothetical protein
MVFQVGQEKIYRMSFQGKKACFTITTEMARHIGSSLAILRLCGGGGKGEGRSCTAERDLTNGSHRRLKASGETALLSADIPTSLVYLSRTVAAWPHQAEQMKALYHPPLTDQQLDPPIRRPTDGHK